MFSDNTWRGLKPGSLVNKSVNKFLTDVTVPIVYVGKVNTSYLFMAVNCGKPVGFQTLSKNKDAIDHCWEEKNGNLRDGFWYESAEAALKYEGPQHRYMFRPGETIVDAGWGITLHIPRGNGR